MASREQMNDIYRWDEMHNVEDDEVKCSRCGLNPNWTQSEEQEKWECEYIEEFGVCSACENEKEGTE